MNSYGMMNEKIWKLCHGPAVLAGVEKCISLEADLVGGHIVSKTGDGASYNGIREWRCPKCFDEHRKRVRQKNG